MRTFSLEVAALPERAAPVRHALATFLVELQVNDDVRTDVITAVGEAIANAVEHAYCGRPTGNVKVSAHLESTSVLVVEVVDRGCFIEPRHRPGRGFGLRIVRAVSQNVCVDTNDGTAIVMRFALTR